MWFIPNAHPLYSRFAPDFVASSEDLKELSDEFASSLMWRSKLSSLPTWLQRWNRVSWMRHLFGRTLKPSMQRAFEESLTGCLPDTPASHSAMQATGSVPMTQDTFSRIYSELSKQGDLWAAFSRTSKGTSHWDTTLFTKAYELWVTELRQESTARKKQAHHTRETASSSLPSEKTNWPTPVTADAAQGAIIGKNDVYRETSGLPRKINQNGSDGSVGLSRLVQIMNWPTPTVSTGDYQNQTNGTKAMKLQGAVKVNLETPRASQRADAPTERKRKSSCLEAQVQIVREIDGPPAQDKSNTRGKQGEWNTRGYVCQLLYRRYGKEAGRALRRCWERKQSQQLTGNSKPQLNPAWVAQLMGTTIEKTFFVPMVTASWNKQQK
jgi:hypothetical protein